MRPSITFPEVINKNYDFLTFTENHVLSALKSEMSSYCNVMKYYKTTNDDIYKDFSTKAKSGVPVIGLRSKSFDVNDFSMFEIANDLDIQTELIICVSSRIDKNHFPEKRYANIILANSLHVIRNNPIKYPNNQKLPFALSSYNTIFNDEDIDLSLLTLNSNYKLLQK